MPTNYPLNWPEGWKKTSSWSRGASNFGKKDAFGEKKSLSLAASVDRVLKELRLLGAKESSIVISTNVKVRLDGLPKSGEKMPEDPGVAVYWVTWDAKSRQQCIAIDIYNRVQDNMAAIAATLSSMRAIQRYGGAEILDRTFSGFTALPSPDENKSWESIFGDDVFSRTELDKRYLIMRSKCHPDRGGSAHAFNEVQKAYEEAKLKLK